MKGTKGTKLLVGLLLVTALTCVTAGYTNKKHRFSLAEPEGWNVDESGLMGTAVIFYGPTESEFTVNANVVVEEIPEGTTLEQYASAGNETLADVLNNYEQISEREMKIGDLDAHERVFTHEMGDRKLVAKQVAVVSEKRAYVLTFTALEGNYDQYVEVFDKMVQSFEVSEASVLVAAIMLALLILRRRS